jgi:hypothetical protein
MRKATVITVVSLSPSACPSVHSPVQLSVRPYVLAEQLGSHWTGFREIRYLGISRKHVDKIQV